MTFQPIRYNTDTYNVTEGLAKIFVDNFGRVGEENHVILSKNRRGVEPNFRYTFYNPDVNIGATQMNINLDEAELFGVVGKNIPIHHFGEGHLVRTNSTKGHSLTDFKIPPGFPVKPHYSLYAKVVYAGPTRKKIKITFNWDAQDIPIRTPFLDLA